MSSEIERQLNNLLKGKSNEPTEGEYIPGEDVPEIPSRTLTPLEVKEMTSEFRRIAEEAEIDIEEDMINDYLNTRDFLYTLLNEVSKALNGAMGLAAETDQPRAYQVVRELLETARELSKDIMSLQKTYKEIKKIDPPKQTPGEGGEGGKTSTTSLLALMEQMEKDKE